MFQYISCCSLSLFTKHIQHIMESFNTSHVVVYPSKLPPPKTKEVGFNTSHVVVYRC